MTRMSSGCAIPADFRAHCLFTRSSSPRTLFAPQRLSSIAGDSARTQPDYNMDPIGATASLITLIVTTRLIVQTIITIYKAIDGAPKALAQITKQLSLVQHSLEYIRKTHSGNESCLPPELQAMLAAALLAVAESVEELERVCKLRHCQFSVQGRLRWALLKKSEAAETMQRLQHAKIDLGHVVQLVYL